MELHDDTPQSTDRTDAPPPPASDGIPPWFVNHLTDGQPLPPELRAVIKDVLEPLYQKMVLEEKDPLLRAAGNAVIVAQTLEVLAQPEVIEAAGRAARDYTFARKEFVEKVDRYLRISKERAKAMHLHLQLRRAKYAKWQVPGDPYGIMTQCGRGI